MKNDIIIFGLTKEVAYKELDRIVSNTPEDYIKYVEKDSFDYIVELYSGVRFLAKDVGCMYRGWKCSVAMVDKNISYEQISNCIEGCLDWCGGGGYMFF